MLDTYVFDITLLKNVIFIIVSIVIIFIDIKRHIIPDVLSIPLIFIGIGFSFITPIPGWKSSVLGALVGFIIFYLIAWLYTRVTKQIGLGGGDVKYLSGIGAFLGIQGVGFVMFFSSVLALVTFTILLLFKNKRHVKILPYAPFLAVAAFGYLVLYNNST